MKNIIDIYKDYNIFNGLQDHMIRVAAVAQIICDNLDQEVEKDHVISACLLHDMGNIIKSKLDRFPELIEPEGLNYWLNIQKEFFNKYGKDEHYATLQMGEEIGVSEKTFRYMNLSEFSNAKNLGEYIYLYSDNRVAPHGIVSLQERIDEGMERYKGTFDIKNIERRNNKLYDFENKIFSHISIEKEYINDETASPIIDDLKSYIIV